MSGIDVISDQVAVGDDGYVRSGAIRRDGGFFHHALAKMGASSGHLDPKKKGRTMCELFEASGWETGVRWDTGQCSFLCKGARRGAGALCEPEAKPAPGAGKGCSGAAVRGRNQPEGPAWGDGMS